MSGTKGWQVFCPRLRITELFCCAEKPCPPCTYKMIDKTLSVEAQSVQASQFAQLIMNGATASLYDQSFASTLREAFVRPSIEKLMAETAGAGKNLYQAVLKKMTAPIDKTRKWFEAGACFVAGTLVHTKDGLVPIEQIKVGDWVLSKSEHGKGDQDYKQVVNTFVHEDKTVRNIYYGTTDGSNYVSDLYVTDNHPFWVVGRGWTRADLLEGGQELELADGSRVMVFANQPVFRSQQQGVGWSTCFQDADLGAEFDFINQTVVQTHVPVDSEILYSTDPFLKLRVYSFEVEDFHTYYVGEMGVWLHNADCSNG